MGVRRRCWRTLSVAAAVLLQGVAGGSARATTIAQLHSTAPAEAYPYTIDAWLLFSYGMSVDCSPPRGCYAASQWIRAYVSCCNGAAALRQRISMDLNGNVVGDLDYDVVRVSRAYTEIVRSVCGIPERDSAPPWTAAARVGAGREETPRIPGRCERADPPASIHAGAVPASAVTRP